jgi:anti-sigma factor RsiW
MITHLSAEEIEDYVKPREPRQEVARVNEHLFSCAACYQRFLSVFQTQRGFPIEIDLDDLAGLRGWHLQGEELKAYVAGQMDELDRGYANLHLRDCAWCREEVSHFSEFTSKLEFYLSRRHAPLKQPRVRRKYFQRPGAMPVAWTPVRLAGAAALVLLLISATLLWSISRTKSQRKDATLSAQSQEDSSSLTRLPSVAQTTDTSQHVQTPRPDASARTGQKSDPKNKSGRSNAPVPAIQVSPNGRNVEKPRREIEASLIAENLMMPSVIEMFDRTPVVLRGDDNKSESFQATSPYSTVISGDQPTFRWTALSGASSYVVSVYDANLNLIETSAPLTETEWLAPSRLKRGRVYTWIVTALKDGKEILAPTLPARAEFKIIESSELLQLNRRIRQMHSGAARGALYAKAGLLDDAEREFQKHLMLYPVDEQVKKLLQTIKSWREP